MERTILHVDCNGFYASVECFLYPEIRRCPVIVCGDAENRQNELAKKYDIKTGEAIWQAQEKYPDLVCVPAHFGQYLKFSYLAWAR